MFTIHVTEWADWVFTPNDNIRYAIYQQELAPTTNAKHYQGYLELSRPARMRQVKTWLHSPTAHLEPRNGTPAQAIAYCSKVETRVEGTEPVSHGQPSGEQGKRNDLEGAVAILKAGGTMHDVLEHSPETLIRYTRGLQSVQELYQSRAHLAPRLDLRVVVLVGPPGCGKTRAVYDLAGTTSVYTLTQSASTTWWNGYQAHPTLLLDDYYGWISWGELLKVLDIYQYRPQTKGGFTYAAYTTVYITSNKPWDHWYKRPFADQGALQRRIHEVWTYSADGTHTVSPPVETPLPAYAEAFNGP